MRILQVKNAADFNNSNPSEGTILIWPQITQDNTVVLYTKTPEGHISTISSNSSGFGNIKHNDRLFVTGVKNIVGGTSLTITAYNENTGTLTVELPSDDSELAELLSAGDTVQIHTDIYDENSPYTATVAEINGTSVKLDSPIPQFSNSPTLLLVEGMKNWDDDESSATIGDYCVNTGIGAVVTGSVNINTGNYSFVNGLCNYNAGECAVITGANNYNTADHVDIGGVNNKLIAPDGYGRYTFIRGNGNIAASDNITVFGTGNEVTGMGATVIGGMNKEVTGRDSFAFGNMLKVVADYAKAWGYQLKNAAKNAFLFGRYGELDDSAENEGVFAIAGGENKNPLLAWIFRTRKAVINPLYNSNLDIGNSGTDSKGEKQYIPKLAFSAQYRGHLLDYCDERTVNVTSGITAVSLDHDWFGRFRITPTGAGKITFSCDNWEDGDRGTLVIVNGANRVVFPASWVWISGNVPLFGQVGGEPATLQSNGYNIIIMFKIENTIFCLPSLRNDGTIDD